MVIKKQRGSGHGKGGRKADPGSAISLNRAIYGGMCCPLCSTPVVLSKSGKVSADWHMAYSHRNADGAPCPWFFRKQEQVCA